MKDLKESLINDMTKQRILVFSHAMELGGAERSLLGLLEAIDYTKYNVDLFLMRHEGELLSYIPKEVNLLPEMKAYTVLARPMLQTLKEGHLLLTVSRVVGKAAAQNYNRKHHFARSEVALEYSHKYTKRWMPKVNPTITYDLAISFLTPHYFVAEKVNAKKRIAWIHTDYSHITIDRESEIKMWSRYDNIASISDAVSQSFISCFPELKDRLVLIENILPYRTILTQMQQESMASELMREGEVRLLSIGRFCDAKNFDSIPTILRIMRKCGKDIHWYLVGFGPDEQLIKSRIVEEGMEGYVHILGKTDNPYPYIKAADIYIQPSRYEGRCVTVKEAQLLEKPVIITRYATSCSQLEEGVDGWIVELDNKKCAEGILQLIEAPEKLKQSAIECSRRDYTNRQEVEKMYGLIE